MNELSYGKQAFMLSHIAAGLQKIDEAVTPEAVERHAQQMEALRAAGHSDHDTQAFAPPNPYPALVPKGKS